MVIILVILPESQTAIWRHLETEVAVRFGQILHGGLRALEGTFDLNNLIVANKAVRNRDKVFVVFVNKLLG